MEAVPEAEHPLSKVRVTHNTQPTCHRFIKPFCNKRHPSRELVPGSRSRRSSLDRVQVAAELTQNNSTQPSRLTDLPIAQNFPPVLETL